MLDESGEAPPRDKRSQEDNAEEKEAKTLLLQRILANLYGAAAKSKPAKKLSEAEARLSRYDRPYLNVNSDLDLTNHPVIELMKNPPWQALPAWPF